MAQKFIHTLVILAASPAYSANELIELHLKLASIQQTP